MGDSGKILTFGDYALDFGRGELRRGERPVDIQPTPLRVLLHLAEHRDRTVSRRELLDTIWPEVVVGDEALTTALAEARHAVGDDGGSQRVIRTLKGRGYRFVAEVVAVSNDSNVAPAGAPATRRSRKRAWLGAGACALALGGLAAAVSLRTAGPERAPFGVAVLPVANLSGDARDQALADGLTEQITTTLSRNGYPVVARTTAAQWRERAADVRELDDALGVSHVIEGSVQRDQERVRVTMQLASTATGMHVWSETFERPSGNQFAIQDQVTDRVAVEVYQVVQEDTARMERDPALAEIAKLAVDARKIWLEGRDKEALAMGERLISILPEREPFLRLRSDAHVRAAFHFENAYAYGPSSILDAGPKFLAHAQAAVAAAPASAYARVALARAYLHHWQWERAEQEMRRACELSPSSWECGSSRSEVCAALGCLEEALEGARLWVRRSPAEWGGWVHLQWVLLDAGRLEEAEAAALRGRELAEISATFLWWIQWRLGKREEAIDSMRRHAAASGALAAAQEIDRIRGQGPEAVLRWFVEQVLRKEPWIGLENQNDFLAAHTLALLGDREPVLDALERSVSEHEAGLEWFALDPVFDPIRDTPRFRALIEKMGLTAYHAKYVKRPDAAAR